MARKAARIQSHSRSNPRGLLPASALYKDQVYARPRAFSEAVVKRAYERDPASASAEYGAQFRADIESFIDIEAVRAVIMPGIFERPPLHTTLSLTRAATRVAIA